MKEIIIWVMLYGVYWYIACVLGNFLWDLTRIDWINDATRIVAPFIFLGITYIILKIKNKIKGRELKVRVSESKFIVNSLKILGICIGGFVMAIVLIHIYIIFAMEN